VDIQEKQWCTCGLNKRSPHGCTCRLYIQGGGNIVDTQEQQDSSQKAPFREHSENNQGIIREHSGNIEHSGNSQGTLQDSSQKAIGRQSEVSLV
jgi:hypothetical protein